MISVKNLTKDYGRFRAVDGVSFEVAGGSIFGFVGPNGAGKTTILRIMATLLPPTAGQVEYRGRPITENPRAIRRLIGYMPDFFGVYDDLRVREYLEFYGEASGAGIREVRRAVPALLELVGLRELEDTFVNNLSRGMKQRLCLARALVHEPELLILDEPASGLDPRARVEFRQILVELQRMGYTVIISSHILSELAQVCTHIGVIHRGKMAACGDIGEVLSLFRGDTVIEIRLADKLEEARLWLLEQQGAGEVSVNNRGSLELFYSGDPGEQAALLKRLSQHFPVYSFTPGANNLEELFMKVTGEDGNAH